MQIEIKERTTQGLRTRETIKCDTVLELRSIQDAYPAHEIKNVLFFPWGDVVIYIKRRSK